jgi:hypothetical protein
MQSIIAGICVGLLVWGMQWLIRFQWNARKIEVALVIDINNRIRELHDVVDFVGTFVGEKVKEGIPLDRTANYFAFDYRVYSSLLPLIVDHFSEDDLRRVQEFYGAYAEFDELAKGFFAGVTEWRDSKRVITGEDVEFLKRKFQRIKAYKDYVQNYVSFIRELPHRMTNRTAPSYVLTGKPTAGGPS